VSCYEGEFKQVILNLIVNAAHAIEAASAQREGGVDSSPGAGTTFTVTIPLQPQGPDADA
jgi:signal transduction histidine kinase